MNILIVDDDQEKSKRISSVVERILVSASSRIESVASLSECRAALRDGQWDLLLLDLHIPQTKDSTSRLDCGLDFIMELSQPRLFAAPLYTIAISSYDEGIKLQDCDTTAGIYAWIRYNADSTEWERTLTGKLQYLYNVLSPAESNSTRYDFDFGIVCALEDIEFGAVLDLPWDWSPPSRPDQDDPTSYYVGKTKSSDGRDVRVVAAAAPQMGMAAMSVLVMKMIAKFKPQYIGMPGIAAAVKKDEKTNFGDILVADLSWDYGSGKLKVKSGKATLSPDLRPIPIDPSLKQLFVDIKRDTKLLEQIRNDSPCKKTDKQLRIHIGPIASGAAVVADVKIVNEIVSQHRKVIGIEMEIYGLYYAAANCSVPRPKVFALKSICDYGDRQKDDTYQAHAAFTSTAVLRHLVEKTLSYRSY